MRGHLIVVLLVEFDEFGQVGHSPKPNSHQPIVPNWVPPTSRRTYRGTGAACSVLRQMSAVSPHGWPGRKNVAGIASVTPMGSHNGVAVSVGGEVGAGVPVAVGSGVSLGIGAGQIPSQRSIAPLLPTA